MYKRALSGLLVINLIFLIGVLSLCRMEEICRKLQQTVSEVHMEESLLADKESIMMGIASRTSSGQRVVDCSELQRESKYQLEQADLEVLLRIVEAEAGCEDEDGKLLVANVILNRLNSEKISGQHYGDRIPAGKRGVTVFSHCRRQLLQSKCQ